MDERTWTLTVLLIGAGVGFLLAQLPRIIDRRAQLTTMWTAVKVELDECERQAQVFMRDGVKAPLYRLPLTAYRIALPTVLADGRMCEPDIHAITRFAQHVEDINRGLDNADELRKGGHNNPALDAETQRLGLKMKNLLEGQMPQRGLLPAAREVIAARIRDHGRRWL